MDFRPNFLKRLELKQFCYDLVTSDRKTFWEATKARMEQRKIDLGGLLRLAIKRSKEGV
jgi:hypothetical protein